MSKDRTMRKLKQVPLEQVEEQLRAVKLAGNTPSIVMYGPNSRISSKSDFYDELNLQAERLKIIIESGWDPIELQTAIEKRSITDMVREINNSFLLPADLVDHIRTYYPNASFNTTIIDLK